MHLQPHAEPQSARRNPSAIHPLRIDRKGFAVNNLLSAFIVTFSCLASVLPASATSVVCIRSPDAVIFAADSMLAVRGADNPGKPRKECKIIQAGRLFFSMTGFVMDPARRYDAARIVAEATKGTADFAGATAAIAAAVKAGLKDEVIELRAEAPDLYDRFIKGQSRTLRVLLAGYEEGTPRTVLLGFSQTVSQSGELAVGVEQEACPGECDPKGLTMLVLGDRRPVDVYLKSGKADWRSPEKAAEILVEQVIAAHTPDVGPPVDVLRIDKEGARWIEKKAECPDF